MKIIGGNTTQARVRLLIVLETFPPPPPPSLIALKQSEMQAQVGFWHKQLGQMEVKCRFKLPLLAYAVPFLLKWAVMV